MSATSRSCQSGRVGCTICPALSGDGTATPMPTTRSPNSRRRAFSRVATSASMPVPETASRSWRSSTALRPVSSKTATVNESSRRSTASATGPCRCAEGTPVGRPRVRGTLSPAGASAGLGSSSMSWRPARSLTSTVAVPLARPSCLVSSARVSWPPPSWTARSNRARLCARNSALVVAAPSSLRTLRWCHAGSPFRRAAVFVRVISRFCMAEPLSQAVLSQDQRQAKRRRLPVPVEADGGLLGQPQVTMDSELAVQGDALPVDDGPVHPVPYRPHHAARQLGGMKLHAYVQVLHERLHDAAELGRGRRRVVEAGRIFQGGRFPGRQRLGQQHIHDE